MAEGRERKGTKLVRKIMAAAGTLSGLALVPGAAQGAVVEVTGSPVSLSMSASSGTTVTWDVDGAGGIDFSLFRSGSGTGGSIQFASIDSTYGSAYNGRGLIAPFSTDNVQALATSFQVGPTLATYTWGTGSYRYRNAMQSGPTIGYDWNYGFSAGENFFGFRFVDGSNNMHYGYGVIDFDLTGAGTVTISRWAYESTADTPIHVQPLSPVPEPGTGALMLLGLGAAGVLAWRKRRGGAKAPAEQAS